MKKAWCNTCGFPLTVMEDLSYLSFINGLCTKMAIHLYNESYKDDNVVFSDPHIQSRTLNSMSVLVARDIG